eukprot:143155-Chlamydomonas_euryale.AAC.3
MHVHVPARAIKEPGSRNCTHAHNTARNSGDWTHKSMYVCRQAVQEHMLGLPPEAAHRAMQRCEVSDATFGTSRPSAGQTMHAPVADLAVL